MGASLRILKIRYSTEGEVRKVEKEEKEEEVEEEEGNKEKEKEEEKELLIISGISSI